MSADKPSDVHHPVRDMAAQIYVQLVSAQVTVSGDAVKIATNPEGLAKVSFKLAEAFLKAEKEIKASAAPTSVKFDVNKLDFDAWTTK
jgi:hypothetical protein